MKRLFSAKKIMRVLSAISMLAMLLSSAMATQKFELSDKLTKVSEIGDSFYPGYTTKEEAEAGMTSDVGKEIIAALDVIAEELPQSTYMYCIVGSDTDYYYAFECVTGWHPWSVNLISRADLEDSWLQYGYYCVCRPAEPEPVPATGDNTPVALMAGALALSGVALVLLRRKHA